MRFTTSCNGNLGYVFVNGHAYLQFDTKGTPNLCLFTILDYSGFISVGHSYVHLVASVLWSSEFLISFCNIFAFCLQYN